MVGFFLLVEFHRERSALSCVAGLLFKRLVEEIFTRMKDEIYSKYQSYVSMSGLLLLQCISDSRYLPGYLKALERGNIVPRQKGFCEADKVNVFNVLLQSPNFCDLHVTDT